MQDSMKMTANPILKKRRILDRKCFNLLLHQNKKASHY
jgi:hypothetical protein